MGLLDQLNAYIQANTPRSTRPVAKPSTVINQGLLNPNKYNAPAANRFKDSAFGLLGVVPGVGDAASAAESADLFNRGEKFAGSIAALGALPLVPALGGMFIGKGAKTWDALAAQKAEEMLAKGVDPREVWKQTGTMRGVDNAMRQEIPDNLAAMHGADPTEEIAQAFRDGGMDAMKARQQELAGYVRPYQRGNVQEIDSVIDHGPLSDAYPDLYHYGKYQYDASNPRIGEGAYYSEKPGSEFATDFIKISPANEQTAKSAMVHELQHAIQQREGWARGGSPDVMAIDPATYSDKIAALTQKLESDAMQAGGRLSELATKYANEGLRGKEMFEYEKLRNALPAHKELAAAKQEFSALGSPYEMYRRLAGEAEARLTQARMNMTMPERLQSYPYDMLDVPQEQLIVRGLLGL